MGSRGSGGVISSLFIFYHLCFASCGTWHFEETRALVATLPLRPQAAAKAARAQLRELKARAQAERTEAARRVLLETGFPRKVVLQLSTGDEGGGEGGSGAAGGNSRVVAGRANVGASKPQAGGEQHKGRGGGQALLPAVLVFREDEEDEDGLMGMVGGMVEPLFACLGADNRLMKVRRPACCPCLSGQTHTGQGSAVCARF